MSYKVVGVVKWHWESEAWQRQTSVRSRLEEPEEPDDEAENGDTDGSSPESSTSSSSSFSSMDSRWKGMTISLLLLPAAAAAAAAALADDDSGRGGRGEVSGDSDDGGRWQVQRVCGFSWCSKSSSWPMKLKLGEMLAFLRRTKS